jgi:hypothetical protein
MGTLNPLVEGNLLQYLKWKVLEISPPLQIAQKVIINPQIKIFEPFDRFHCLMDSI